MLKSKNNIGTQFEVWVCKKLRQLGYQTVHNNFHSPYGEIDIIAIHQNTLVFIEVKARSSTIFGQPYEAVTAKKLARIIKTGHYFRSNFIKPLPVATRIDVASVLTNSHGDILDFQLMQNVTR